MVRFNSRPVCTIPCRRAALISFSVAGLFLAGCATAPAPAPVVAKPKPAPAPVAVVDAERVYSNMSVSEAKNVSSPFKTEKGTVFPENKWGYRLVLTGGVSMPNLVATEVPPSDILVQARVFNRSDEPQTLDIIFAVGDDHETYHAKHVVFPANRARDIRFTLSQQATQNLSLIVTRSH